MHEFGVEPEVLVHEHCAEAGAIGAALEALRLYREGQVTRFPGLGQLRQLRFETTTGEGTRCTYCANHCLRTFIDYDTAGHRERIILGSCEKGSAQNTDALRETVQRLRAVKDANPNLIEIAARTVTLPQRPPNVADPVCRLPLTPRQAARNRLLAARGKVVLFSSHELETVERVCSHIVILHKGRVVANDSIEQLRALMSLPTLEGIFSQLAVEQDTAAITRGLVDVMEA
jgi:hypothetical protein